MTDQSSELSKPHFRAFNTGSKITVVIEGLRVEEVQGAQAELTRSIVEAIKHRFEKGGES